MDARAHACTRVHAEFQTGVPGVSFMPRTPWGKICGRNRRKRIVETNAGSVRKADLTIYRSLIETDAVPCKGFQVFPDREFHTTAIQRREKC